MSGLGVDHAMVIHRKRVEFTGGRGELMESLRKIPVAPVRQGLVDFYEQFSRSELRHLASFSRDAAFSFLACLNRNIVFTKHY